MPLLKVQVRVGPGGPAFEGLVEIGGVMNRLMERIRLWLSRRTAPTSGDAGFGEPGTTQRPGRSSGGPAEGPMTGGSAGPAGPEKST